MKEKITVLFNNTKLPDFDRIKEELFEEYAEEEGWETKDDIPDSVVYHEMDEMQHTEWDNFVYEMERLFDKDYHLLTGTCGRWDGPAEGGKFVRSFDELLDAIRHLDYMKFYEENFLAIPEVEIDGYTLDEPDYEVKENKARRKNNKKD